MPEVLPDVELPEPPDEHRPPRLWGSGGAGGAGGVVEETVAGYIGMLLTCFAVAVVLYSAYLFVVPVYLLGAYIYASWESRKTASK
ncbi:hypothetical protein HS125_20700 [bacterium]|nr:hypothetical protein [bacterium]